MILRQTKINTQSKQKKLFSKLEILLFDFLCFLYVIRKEQLSNSAFLGMNLRKMIAVRKKMFLPIHATGLINRNLRSILLN